MTSPALSQLHPKSKVTGFASFSQLLLGNANADADNSTGFLWGWKDSKSAQALFQKLGGRRELSLFFWKAKQEFRGYQTHHNHEGNIKQGLSSPRGTACTRITTYSSISSLGDGWILTGPLLCLSAPDYQVSEIAVKFRPALLTSSTGFTSDALRSLNHNQWAWETTKDYSRLSLVSNCSQYTEVPSALGFGFLFCFHKWF